MTSDENDHSGLLVPAPQASEPSAGSGKDAVREALDVSDRELITAVETELQTWLDWCGSNEEEPEARSGARLAVDAIRAALARPATTPSETASAAPASGGGEDAAREALREVSKCFEAAITEGLADAIEQCPYDHPLKNLVTRRLMPAYETAIRALATRSPADAPSRAGAGGEAEAYPSGVTAAEHIAHDMKRGRFPNRSSISHFIAERDPAATHGAPGAGTPDAEAVAREPLEKCLYGVLRKYRLSNMGDEDGDNYPLVDVVTPEGRNIGEGEEELGELAFELACAVLALLADPAQSTRPGEV